MKKKAIPFTPFFYKVTALNNEICSVAEEDFASNGQEILDVHERLVKKFPPPAYEIRVAVCESVVKS